jgi:hypothetical protein
VRRQPTRTVRLRRTALSFAVVAVVLALALIWVSSGGGSGQPANAGRSPSAVAATKATTSTSTTVTPTTAAPTTTTSIASPLGPSAQTYADSRQGTITAAALDLNTGQTWTLGGDTPQDEASIVKVNILETLLGDSGGQGLPTSEQSLAQTMIEESDNDSATDLWDDANGTSGLSSFDANAGLQSTTPSSCVECAGFPWPGWGLTTTTPQDQITLLRLLAQPNKILTTSEQQYMLNLMENVTSSEQWGVDGGVPSGVTVALKNGWLPLDSSDTDWQINSIGWINGDGRNYLLAVMTTGDPSEQYGIDTIDNLSSTVFGSLG